MKRILSLFFIILPCGIFFACNRQDNISQLISDGNAPGPVTNLQVKNTPGGAIFSYTPPPDDDLLYVQVAYKLSDGRERTVNSSLSKNAVEIEGLANTDETQATLTTVDKSGNKSAPYVVSFKPLTPPIVSVSESMKLISDFGGVTYTWKNALKTPLALLLFYKDKEGKDQFIDSHYSDAADGSFTLRGRDTSRTEYSVVLRDKWQNLSGKVAETLSPLYEVLIDRTKFVDMGSTYKSATANGNSITGLWDNNLDDNATTSTVIPWNAAFDMGVTVKMSRLVIRQYSFPFNNYGHYYSGGNARVIEIYGSNAPSPTNVIDDKWTLVKSCEIVKPSGLPIAIGRTNMTEEDFDLARNRGHEYIVPLDMPPFRYIMIRVVRGWETTLGSFCDLKVYGQPR